MRLIGRIKNVKRQGLIPLPSKEVRRLMRRIEMSKCKDCPPCRSRKLFRKTIKDWRERKGFTQADAAEKLGISIRTLQNWEDALNMPREYGLNALVKALASDRN